MHPRFATSLLTYCFLLLAGGISFALPDDLCANQSCKVPAPVELIALRPAAAKAAPPASAGDAAELTLRAPVAETAHQ